MSQNETRLKRQRITAPRTVEEAHQMIARIKATFGIVDMEDQYDEAMSIQEAKFAETLYEYILQTAGAAMQAAGLTELTMDDNAINLAQPFKVSVHKDPDSKRTTFKLVADDEQAGDENYALPATPTH